MQKRTIAFIGAGNMSRSIINGLHQQAYPADLITASNPSIEKLERLQDEFNINISQDNQLAAETSDVIVLAVKPQLIEQVCNELAIKCDLSGKLFISIAAGIPVNRLTEMLKGQQNIVRTMPNTPSQLGKGMTGIFAPDNVSQEDTLFVVDLMQQVGETVTVSEERQIDAVIAAAGSSPAYFFRFLEAMQKEAEKMGFDHESARKLVQQSMLGAAEMVCHNQSLELEELRAQVTSKGGTTAKAIESFESNNIDSFVSAAMQAAVKRAEEMALQF